MMETLLRHSKTLSRWLVWLAGALILLAALLVSAEVFLRKFFNFSFGGADELSGYAFGIATTLAFAFALFERAHIRVDATYNAFPGWLRIVVNFLGLLLLIGFAAVIATHSWSMVSDSIEYGSKSITPMRTPLAIPQTFWLAGWIFFIFCGLVIGMTALKRLMTGDPKGADQLIGIKSMEEQIEDERG